MRRLTLSLVLVLVAAAGSVAAQSRIASAYPATNGVVVFRSDRGGTADLFSVGAEGGNESGITATQQAHEYDAAVSPEGTRIAFARRSTSPGARTDLFVMSLGGGGRMRLTSTPVPERQPDWSPDGTRIVYTARTSRHGPFRLFSINADGRDREPLTTQSGDSYDMDPAWSPDGSKIAFVTNRDGGFPEIYVMNADGSGRRRLTQNTQIDADPSWSPDGSRIAFVRCCADGSHELYTMNADGSGQTPLLASVDEESDPAWSPDGTKIAYVSFPAGGGNVDVWTVGADGTAPLQLTTDAAVDLAPSWEAQPVCSISGTTGPDTLTGTEGPDVICGLDGDDVILAGGGNDLVLAGGGNDQVQGEAGNDLLFGAGGDDFLSGREGYDGLFGGGGADTCLRGAGGGFVRQCEA